MIGPASMLSYEARRWKILVLKAYYDCGNKLDSREYKVVTLAGAYADASVWRRLEKKWAKIFLNRQFKSLHVTDALSGNGVYKTVPGWDQEKSYELVLQCTETVMEMSKEGIGLVACSAVLADYRIARDRIPDLAPLEHLLSEYCVGISFVGYGNDLFRKNAALFFDRGEPFGGYMINLWNHRKVNLPESVWSAISAISYEDSSKAPGLQVCDLIAWSINHAYSHGNRAIFEWQKSVLACETLKSRMLDKAFFVDIPRIDRNVQRLRNLKLHAAQCHRVT